MGNRKNLTALFNKENSNKKELGQIARKEITEKIEQFGKPVKKYNDTFLGIDMTKICEFLTHIGYETTDENKTLQIIDDGKNWFSEIGEEEKDYLFLCSCADYLHKRYKNRKNK